MSSDLKIEIFAYHCFYSMWLREDATDTELIILEIYGDECKNNDSYKEVCDVLFQRAIDCRLRLFYQMYIEELDLEKVKRWKSLSDCCDHLTSICDREDLFGHLSVFERMLATCAFFVYVSYSSVLFQCFPINVAKYGYMIWAMYFDKYIETFYEEGGWKELKKVAKSYDLLMEAYIFLQFNTYGQFFPGISKEFSVNYSQFRNAVKCDTYRCKNDDKSLISKLWIKFRIEHFEKYVIIPKSYSVNCFEAELFLQHLKLICDPFWKYDPGKLEILEEQLQKILCSTGITNSETFDKSEAIKTFEDLQNLPISETFCDETLNVRKDFETELKAKFPTSCEKVETLKMIDMKENFEEKCACAMEISEMKSKLKLDDNLPETNLSVQRQTRREYLPKSSDLKLNYNLTSFDGDNVSYFGDTSSRRDIAKHQSERKNATDVLSTNWKDEPMDMKISLKNLPNTLDFCFESKLVKSHAEKKISETEVESTVNAKTNECNENIELNYTLYTNRVATTQSDRNAIPKNSLTSQEVSHLNEITKNYDGRINIKKGLDIPRKEKKDPEIKNFLRMFQVLDDREGMKYILQPSNCSEESRENSQVRISKKKKRSKKSRK